MKKFLYVLIVLIVLSAALKWFLYFSFRVNYYEVLMILFIFFFFLSNYNVWSFKLKQELKTYIQFLWGWFFLAGLSGFGVIIYPQGVGAYSFYLKGLLQLFVHTCFFTFFVFYLSSISSNKRNRLVSWLLAGIVISSIYGFAQLIIIKQYGIDIDERIARYLGMSLADGEYLNLTRYAYGYLYRLNGITGDPSVHAAYTIMALPLLLLCYIRKRNIGFLIGLLIVFISLVLSMSGSGLVGSVFSVSTLLVLGILRKRHLKIRYMALVLGLVVILLLLYSSFEEHIAYFANVRFDPQGTIATHLDIAIKSLHIGLKYPLGVGYNNFSIAYEDQYGISGYNPHNTWLGYFVQMGLIGLLYQIMFTLFIIRQCFKKKTLLSQAFISSVIGICIASLGYQVLDMFYVRLFITLFFTVVILEEGHIKSIGVKMANNANINKEEFQFRLKQDTKISGYFKKDLPHQV